MITYAPEATPGLYRVPLLDGSTRFRWKAQDCTSRDISIYPIKSCALRNQEPGPAQAAECQKYALDLHAWISAHEARERVTDGTVAGLVKTYRTHAKSPYRKVKPSTAAQYDKWLKHILRMDGHTKLAKLGAEDFLRWHEQVLGGEDGTKLRTAQGVISVWRRVLSWTTALEVSEASRLQGIIANLRFPAPGPRRNALTFEQANNVIEMAWDMGHPSLGLAQAFQFECALRQIDVIGEWVPATSKLAKNSPLTKLGKSWIGGLEWHHIGEDYVLRKRTTKKGAMAIVDLRFCPLVMAQIARMFPVGTRREGPIIISQTSALPYNFWAGQYVGLWRRIARKAGIPDDVYNMDSRAGGITEATNSGAALEDARHLAGHTNVAMTARYSRDTLTKTRNVGLARMRARSGEVDAT